MSVKRIGTAVVLLIPVLLVAESGKITGNVRDAYTGGSLWAANVVISKPQTDPVTGTATDSCGHYLIYLVPEGTYSMEFSFIGYETLIKENIQVKPGDITRVDASLIQSSISMPEVVISAERPLIYGPEGPKENNNIAEPPPGGVGPVGTIFLPVPIPISSRPVDNIQEYIEDVVPGAFIIP
jgi:hypothetical protein